MFVPQGVEQLVKSAGIENHKLAGTQSLGGSRVHQHWDLEEAKNKAKPALESGQIDIFTMAAHLEIPDRGITSFTELGLAHNPNLRLLVQASWMPYDITDFTAPEKHIKDNAERDGIDVAALRDSTKVWRTKLEAQADDLNKKHGRKAVYVVNVGDAVNTLREQIVAGKFPGVTKQSELFRDPIGHGNGHVMALCTYCNFVAIYRRTPEGLKMNTMGVDDAQHAILQRIAWETVSAYPYSGVK